MKGLIVKKDEIWYAQDLKHPEYFYRIMHDVPDYAEGLIGEFSTWEHTSEGDFLITTCESIDYECFVEFVNHKLTQNQ